MVWDPVSQQIYLSVASASGSNASTVTALNPQTAVLGSSVSPGDEPGTLALSSDGTYLYAGLNTTGSVQRYQLPALQSDIAIPLGNSTSNGSYFAISLAVDPLNSHSVAIARAVHDNSIQEIGGIALYDDAVARTQTVAGFGPAAFPIDQLLWNSNGQTIYGFGTEGFFGISDISVNSTGLQLLSQPTSATSMGTAFHFDAATGDLYTDSGEAVNPATGSVIGKFPTAALQGGFNQTSVMAPDGKLNIAYFLGPTNGGTGSECLTGSTGNCVIEAFDMTQFALLGAIDIPNISGAPTKMIRWGNNGLAFLTNASGNNVYLISGAFVTSPAP